MPAHRLPVIRKILAATFLAALFSQSPASVAAAAPVEPPGMRQRLSSGAPQEMLILLDEGAIAKSHVIGALRAEGGEVVTDYSHLPMLFARIRSTKALDRLLTAPGIQAVYENRVLRPHLAESLPLIGQPPLAAIGKTGSGTTVAIIDSGINYTLPAFGSCTAPGVPADCKVAASVDIATNDNALDDLGHGTNVAGIVAGVAPGAKLAVLDVFNPDGTSSDALVIAGINWAISNRATYNIVAINMSLGDGSRNTAACSNRGTNPYVTPINNAKSAGIVTVISAGNEGYTDGISRPACTPAAVSVGAVYDANVGGIKWTACTDATSGADKVPCMSNTATFLNMLAPGAFITAAGSTMGGTSQAAPHVAGSVAVLKAQYPNETPDQLISRLISSGKPVTDQRTGGVFPRLDLFSSMGLPDSNFVPAMSPWGIGLSAVFLGGALAVRRRS
ncbi:peptidase S8 and S53 subtilisin kexin sedolisin [Geobacter metallireducens RCH3]|uniref:Serine protease, subtilase family n=1 Tax=Geobacter metallireducens (strain ATCC 53774 / DSM 7210 / GS-15) TaxID=269799 RepID=Q39VP1_GEOMG|nr:IPTL-CTERM sorting domain-containing protein [Geobacter metallireducens]ABB31683.1 serine protease, subtilase family [Geobacter metallireducens GS-15]EHP89441.1 peptidase S8 and S53 subtilisin kexin sedolisin [Geobacter metallireducens RCH3]